MIQCRLLILSRIYCVPKFKRRKMVTTKLLQQKAFLNGNMSKVEMVRHIASPERCLVRQCISSMELIYGEQCHTLLVFSNKSVVVSKWALTGESLSWRINCLFISSASCILYSCRKSMIVAAQRSATSVDFRLDLDHGQDIWRSTPICLLPQQGIYTIASTCGGGIIVGGVTQSGELRRYQICWGVPNMTQLKRKTYTAAYKLKVVTYATSINPETVKENGNRAAAKVFGVGESMVRRWRKNTSVLLAGDGNKRANRFKRPKWPELEERVKDWVLEQRAEKRKVSTISIRLEARRLADVMHIEDFNGGSGWCYNFMRRADLSMRASTSVGQHIPANANELIANFRSFVKAEITAILTKDLGNMDEVPVTFDMPGRYTVDVRGAQDVGIATTGSEKTNFTVVLGVTADGGICPPMVIFKRKSVPKDTPPGIVVKANTHGWMNEDLMCDWIEECWMGREDPAKSPEKALLILDAARCHITMEAKKAIQKRAKIAVIPGGLTKYLQPLDISVNKSFKAKLRQRWEEWMIDDAKHSFTKQGHMRHATYREVCLWVLQSIQEVTAQCIRNGFRRALEEDQPDANEIREDASE